MTDSTLLPEGFRDRLPPHADRAARLESAMLSVLASHGYDRVDPPLAEFLATLTGDMGGRASEDMLRFTDPISQRTLALRSDMTMQVGRIATTVLANAPRPLRLSYAGAVLKLRAGQLRPERAKRQIGAELIGNDSVAAATEIVTIAIEALVAAGIDSLTLDFTLPDLVDVLADGPLPLSGQTLNTVRAELDMKDAGAIRALGAQAYLPLLEATGEFDAAMERLCAFDAKGALASRIAGLREIAEAVPAGVRLTLDPTERHGFEYQSWFGFSLFADGYTGAVGRGGSYRVGADEVATGFSLYPDPLVELSANGDDRRRLFLPVGHDRDAAARLRKEGWQTVAAVSDEDDAAALGCTHRLDGDTPVQL